MSNQQQPVQVANTPYGLQTQNNPTQVNQLPVQTAPAPIAPSTQVYQQQQQQSVSVSTPQVPQMNPSMSQQQPNMTSSLYNPNQQQQQQQAVLGQMPQQLKPQPMVAQNMPYMATNPSQSVNIVQSMPVGVTTSQPQVAMYQSQPQPQPQQQPQTTMNSQIIPVQMNQTNIATPMPPNNVTAASMTMYGNNNGSSPASQTRDGKSEFNLDLIHRCLIDNKP